MRRDSRSRRCGAGRWRSCSRRAVSRDRSRAARPGRKTRSPGNSALRDNLPHICSSGPTPPPRARPARRGFRWRSAPASSPVGAFPAVSTHKSAGQSAASSYGYALQISKERIVAVAEDFFVSWGESGSSDTQAERAAMRKRHENCGFTLVELLIVIGILTVLIGILLPVSVKARAAGNRVTCRGHLSDIGKLFQMYLNDSKGKLPQWLNPIPSENPPVLPGRAAPEIFDPYAKGVRDGWRCPSDSITREMANTPAGFETYFDREGLSYFYNPQLRAFFAGMR